MNYSVIKRDARHSIYANDREQMPPTKLWEYGFKEKVLKVLNNSQTKRAN